jgi:glycerophosphoryl diester phosphodiesterase
MLIIGHRGAAGLEPENTIRSFKKAEEYKVDMIEMDLRKTVDNKIVIFHDPDLERLFGVQKEIKDLTVKEIKRISADYDREIPTLQEVLEAVSTPLNFHVKVHNLEADLIKTLRNFSHKVLISSIYPKVLKKVRALDEKADLGLIIGRSELHLLFILHWLTWNLNLYSIHPRSDLIFPAGIRALRTLGRKIFVWTVNDRDESEKLRQMGVDGIFTDCPQLFTKVN